VRLAHCRRRLAADLDVASVGVQLALQHGGWRSAAALGGCLLLCQGLQCHILQLRSACSSDTGCSKDA
jgi:hypothetical protein